MALVSADNVKAQAIGFGSLTAVRQLGLMVGLAVSVALGVTVAMWSQEPNYSMLYASLSAKDMSLVTQALEKSGVKYQIEQGSGAILVDSEKIHEARMKIATTGITMGGDVGFELLEKEQGFGNNSFLQQARYHRALEGELAQSISKINVVESARVHIAIPKKSVFARKSSKPTVSVVLNIFQGRVLDDMQVSGIINIVASSVPELDAENVTVIDQKGRLLSSDSSNNNMLLSSTQMEYTNRLEEKYVHRIMEMVSPIIGSEGVRAQVVAEIDFTSKELTSESYLPEQAAIRSEQVFEETNNQSSISGVPGALSNQPPISGAINADIEVEGNVPTGSSTKRAVRNYELDRTISHTRQSPASLKRLSVAVVVDYRTIPGKRGKVTREALTEDEIAHITALVKESVGLNEARGDTINVVNTPFQLPEAIEPVPDTPLLEQPWLMTLLKQILGVVIVLLIAFGVLKPILSNLAKQGKPVLAAQAQQLALGEDQLSLSQQAKMSGQQLQELALGMAHENPKRVAQVMNTWVEKDG